MSEDIYIRIRDNIREFSQNMSIGLRQFQKLHEKTGELKKDIQGTNTRLGRMALKFRKAIHGMRGFKMEMLSVMFFGMGMKRFFGGLLRPALQATGIFELWGTVLQTVFLPTAMKILEFLLPWFQKLMNLDEATKLLIGKWVLIGIVVGGALAILGAVALGIGGIILVFGGLFTIIDKIIPDFEVMGLQMSGFVESGLGIGIITSLWGKLKKIVSELWKKFLKLDFVQETMERLGITLEDGVSFWTQIKDKVREIWDNLKENSGLSEINDELNLMNDSLEEIAGLARTINNIFKTGAKIWSVLTFLPRNLPPPFGGGGGFVPKQTGGFISHTGLYKLHAGETVSQAGSNNFSPTIIINASSNMDIEMMKSQLSTQWNDELNRLGRR